MNSLFIEDEEIIEDMSRLRHGKAMARIVTQMSNFCNERQAGEVYIEPDVFLPNQSRKVIPDIAFVAQDNSGFIDENDIFRGAPDLIVEIISPSTYIYDLEGKKRLYAESGVNEYWLAFPEARIIQINKRNNTGEYQLLQVAGEKDVVSSVVLDGLQIKVSDCF